VFAPYVQQKHWRSQWRPRPRGPGQVECKLEIEN
jgi:hypothetical protein